MDIFEFIYSMIKDNTACVISLTVWNRSFQQSESITCISVNVKIVADICHPGYKVNE